MCIKYNLLLIRIMHFQNGNKLKFYICLKFYLIIINYKAIAKLFFKFARIL